MHSLINHGAGGRRRGNASGRCGKECNDLFCIICGRTLATKQPEGQEHGTEDGGGWVEGHMILIEKTASDGVFGHDTETMTPEGLKERWPNARTCQPGESA